MSRALQASKGQAFCADDTEQQQDEAEKAAAGTALPADDSDFLSGDSEDDSNSLVNHALKLPDHLVLRFSLLLSINVLKAFLSTVRLPRYSL